MLSGQDTILSAQLRYSLTFGPDNIIMLSAQNKLYAFRNKITSCADSINNLGSCYFFNTAHIILASKPIVII